jgi:uncharacterized membrane protein HdeD (DUF308 family)
MDVTQVSDWLKNTIPGIVVLGAIGSLVAVGALALAKRVFDALGSRFKEQWSLLLQKLLKPIVKELVTLYIHNDSYRGQAYFAYQLMKFVIAMIVMISSAVAFIYTVSQMPETFFQWAALLPAVIFFLAFYVAVHCFLRIWVPVIVPKLGQYIEETKREVLAKLEADRKQKNVN